MISFIVDLPLKTKWDTMNFRLWIIIVILGVNTNISQAQDKRAIDSLEHSILSTNGLEKLTILLDLSKAYWNVSPKIGIDYSDKAYQLAVELDHEHFQAKALTYGGVNYWYMGIYDKAIKYYHDALRIAENNNDKKIVGFLFNNIGMVYFDLGDYEKAYENYFNAAGIMKTMNDDIEYAKIVDNIAKIHVQKKEYSKALTNYLSIIDVIKEEDNQEFLLWVLSEIGQIYFKTKKYEDAEDYYLQSLEMCNRIDDNIGKAMVLNNLGILFQNKKEHNKALYNLKESLKYAEKAEAKERIKEIYHNLSDYYSDLGYFKEALEYYELYKAMSDSIFNVEKVEKISEVQTKYEIETKEKENELLRKDNEIQQLEIAKQTTIRNFFIALTILILILVVLILNRLQTKKKVNKTLSQKNELITSQKEKLNDTLNDLQEINEELIRQKKEIQSQADMLKESNATKDKLFSIVAHDLKGPFAAILGYSELLKDEYDTFSNEERIKVIRDVHNSALTVFSLLENMLTWASSQLNVIEVKKMKISLSTIISESIKPYLPYADQKGVKVFTEIPEELELFTDKFTIAIVFGNLMNNSIKFTPQNGCINISAEKKDGCTEIIFQDTGIGMREDTVRNLFRIEKKRSTPGTNMEKGTGLGLIIAKEFIKLNNASIRVESEIGKGSIFIITVPD